MADIEILRAMKSAPVSPNKDSVSPLIPSEAGWLYFQGRLGWPHLATLLFRSLKPTSLGAGSQHRQHHRVWPGGWGVGRVIGNAGLCLRAAPGWDICPLPDPLL